MGTACVDARLRSASTSTLVVPSSRRSTLGDRAFPVAAARAWNSMPPSVRSTSSLASFCLHLKTHLFAESFPRWNSTPSQNLVSVQCPCNSFCDGVTLVIFIHSFIHSFIHTPHVQNLKWPLSGPSWYYSYLFYCLFLPLSLCFTLSVSSFPYLRRRKVASLRSDMDLRGVYPKSKSGSGPCMCPWPSNRTSDSLHIIACFLSSLPSSSVAALHYGAPDQMTWLVPGSSRAVFWGRQLKRSSTFLRKKRIRMTWLEDFVTSKWPGSFTALAPPLK